MKIISVSTASVENTISTQCNYVRTALCEDGTIWENDDTHPEWHQIAGPSATPSLDGLRAMVGRFREAWKPQPPETEWMQGNREAFGVAADELAAEIERLENTTKETP